MVLKERCKESRSLHQNFSASLCSDLNITYRDALLQYTHYMPHKEVIEWMYLPRLPPHSALSMPGCATFCPGLMIVVNHLLFLMPVQPAASPVYWQKLTKGLLVVSVPLVIQPTPAMQNENYNHNTAVSRIIKRYVSSI
jgi:hypothetical protein